MKATLGKGLQYATYLCLDRFEFVLGLSSCPAGVTRISKAEGHDCSDVAALGERTRVS